jgi:hypothetical protein
MRFSGPKYRSDRPRKRRRRSLPLSSEPPRLYQGTKMTDPQSTALVHDDLDTYLSTTFVRERIASGLDTSTTEVHINGDFADLKKCLPGFTFMGNSPTSGVFLSDAVQVWVYRGTWTMTVKIMGDPISVESLKELIVATLPSNPCFIKWVYDPAHLDYLTVPINHGNLPFGEMYPFLKGEKIEDFYQRFIDSPANILVLIGPPGTGKTTFIRGLLSYAEKSATLAYHQKILEQDSFFVQWIESKDMFMILEDSDTLLLPREDGNDMMARFLNLGDGLMSFQGKKMIFSTNLPSSRDIDEALVRPGRCFDVVEFGPLNREQSAAVATKAGVALPEGDSLTISEIFAASNRSGKQQPRKVFGFAA